MPTPSDECSATSLDVPPTARALEKAHGELEDLRGVVVEELDELESVHVVPGEV